MFDWRGRSIITRLSVCVRERELTVCMCSWSRKRVVVVAVGRWKVGRQKSTMCRAGSAEALLPLLPDYLLVYAGVFAAILYFL
jgi:hypothetical protein